MRARQIPRAVPGLSRSQCQKAGGAGRQGRLSFIFRTPDTWRPAQLFCPKAFRSSGVARVVRSHLSRAGLRRRPSRTCPAVSQAPQPSSRRSGPAVVRGGRISDGAPSLARESPNRPWASRARGSRDPGRRRRSRPTLRRLARASPGGRDGGKAKSKHRRCQGIFSGTRHARVQIAAHLMREPLAARIRGIPRSAWAIASRVQFRLHERRGSE